MALFEDQSAAFIVRVWCESGGEVPGAVRAWRGSIEHVSTGQRVFFMELDAVIAFMRPHLVALGIEEPNRFWERMDDLDATPPRPAALLPAYPDTAAAAPAVRRKSREHGR